MRNLYLILFFFSITVGICQTEKKTFREISKEYEVKQDTNSVSHYYSKALSNNIHYNTSYGSSKYDKDINWDADVNPNDIEGSLKKFREEKRNEEILFYTKMVLSVLGILAFLYLSIKFFITKKHCI